MKTAKIFIVLTFLLAFAVCVSAQIVNDKKFKITTKDKSEILEQVFAEGFKKLIDEERFLQCTIPIINDEKIILINTTETENFPKVIGEYKFKFMTDKEIQAEIKSNNGDCYFNVGLNFINSTEVNVSLWRWIKVITVINGESKYPLGWAGGTGRVYKALKVKGIWEVKYLNGMALYQ